jgi:hypothetical protein
MVKAARAAPSPGALHPLDAPIAVPVTVNGDGRPTSVQVGREALAVASIEDRWRLMDEWWREEPISRDYFEVLLEDGRRATIFHDNLTKSWWRQRYG